MDRVFAGNYVLWFVLLLLVGKILATSLTLWIGGSGGVFAPSLFIGAATGTAFGVVCHHLFGAAIGPVALYGVVGMGAVFAGAAQAPLTAIASVAEMTGNFTLTLPIMLACGLASQLARQITHGSIYTTKLLRRGIDIERPKAIGALRALTVEQVMQPLRAINGQPREFRGERHRDDTSLRRGRMAATRRAGHALASSAGAVRRRGPGAGPPPARALRPRRASRPLTRRPAQGLAHPCRHPPGADHQARDDRTGDQRRSSRHRSERLVHHRPPAPAPTRPLPGYELLELRVNPDSPALGRQISEIPWPAGSAVVALTHGREVHAAAPELRLHPGERVLVLAPLRECTDS